jgi:phage I-like protein
VQSFAVLATGVRPIEANGDAPPSEFLLFSPGQNANYNADRKGEPQPVFTRRSAARVREAAALKASDYFVDLEHAAVRSDAPGSTDAMAWFRVEVRPDGSCWAVNVRWTPEGERRLKALSQRYISPVFYFDRDTGEVTEFCGCALTSDPATYGAAPLVAARRLTNVNDTVSPASLTFLRNVAEARLSRALGKLHGSNHRKKDSRRDRGGRP